MRLAGEGQDVFSLVVLELLDVALLLAGNVGDSKEGDDSLEAEPTSQSSSPPDAWPTVNISEYFLFFNRKMVQLL